ncbi:hypothetical protein Ddye_007654 [Dipteronia dyeriana]|uniref:Uncharacterized protein n=1 Tax=Dipteronia dyeriana TaxID=168575 RepID=A0AAE0CRW1_9ROSI|nr:hypothetical protein Ddye_007654 [Dipteronia dyeriana]
MTWTRATPILLIQILMRVEIGIMDGLHKESPSPVKSRALFQEGLIFVSSLGNDKRDSCDSFRGPSQILFRYTNNSLGSISDKEKGIVRLPLRGPIQLPLALFEGGQLKGRDLMAVPLSVELDAFDSRSNSPIGPSLKEDRMKGIGSKKNDMSHKRSNDLLKPGRKAK